MSESMDCNVNERLSTKKELRAMGFTPKLRPPRLLPKSSFDRSFLPNTPVMLLTDENSKNVSPVYNESLDVSYFYQCYEQIYLMGTGSYGEVFKVRCRDNNQFYALKRTHDPYYSFGDRATKLAEIRKYARIPDHENIIKLVNAWEQDDFVYTLMEAGMCSLGHYVEDRQITCEAHLWNILLDILLALNCMHDQQLIHLDIKLDNIILFRNGTCKLADFNLTIHLKEEIEMASEGDGTYVPYELMRGKYTKAADVFSLGISMLELCTDLMLPPNGKFWHDLRNLIFPPMVIEKAPKDLLNIIKRMMNKDYKRRPSVKTLLRHPRLKSMRKQRRMSKEERVFKVDFVGCAPPMGTLPMELFTNKGPSTSSRVPATPPLGQSTPDISFLLNSFESLQKSAESEDPPRKLNMLAPELVSGDEQEAVERTKQQKRACTTVKKLFSP